MLLRNTKEWITALSYSMDEPQEHYVNEGNQMPKTYIVLLHSFIWNVSKRQIYRDRNQISNGLGLEGRVGVNSGGRHLEAFWGDGNVLKLVCSDGCTTL